jgi:hypothetical protein
MLPGRTRTAARDDLLRRSWGNLRATINRAWSPADFDTLNYSAPSTTPRSTYLDPLQIMSARYFKIGVQIDF